VPRSRNYVIAAVLAGLLSLVNAVTSLVLASQGAAKINHSSNQPPYAIVVGGVVVGLIGVVAAYGVFRTQRWAVVLTLVLMALNVLVALPGVAFGPTVFDKVGSAVSVLVAGAVIYLLLRRDRAAESKVEQQAVALSA
jgi:uncharacterized membrane protein (DUF2068 family)